MLQNEEDLSKIEATYPDVKIKISQYKTDYQKVTLITEQDLITPFLDRILGNPCNIEVERIIPNA